MDTFFPGLNEKLIREADVLLYERGLMDTLRDFGTPHIHGSYALKLMTWRDLDIYLESDLMTEADFFSLGQKICVRLAPVKMSFRNELIAKTKGLPAGLYWGIYLGNEREGAWKIDIWSVSSQERQRLMKYHLGLQKKLTQKLAQTIMQIKSQCWQEPGYRRLYNSSDIYSAVLDQGVNDIEEFKNYLKTLKRTE